jgi:hypothetical protein
MKQFLIVVFSLALVVFAYVFYRGSAEGRPDDGRQRPALQKGARATGARRPAAGGNLEKRTVMTPDGERVVGIDVDPSIKLDAEAMMAGMTSSWRDFVHEDSVIPMEEAWDFDLSSVDFTDDVLIKLETGDGARIEITRDDWRRYVVITSGRLMVQGDLMEAKGRGIAKEYKVPYGLTDSQWDTFFAAWCRSQNRSIERGRRSISMLYDLPENAAMRTRRQQVESVLAYYPTVTLTANLPKALVEHLTDPDDQKYVKVMLSRLARAREDLDNPDNLAQMQNALEPLTIIFDPIIAELEFRHDWTYLDGDMPEDAVAACFVGEIQDDELLPPWLQPVGEVVYVGLEDAWARLDTDKFLHESVAREMLRQVIWLRVLGHQLEKEGLALTPEERWQAHAKEYLARKDTLMTMDWLTSELYEYPSVSHYRTIMGVFRAFQKSFPEGWDSDENLAKYYAQSRIFIERWQPAIEVILFPPRQFDDGMTIDWERARLEAEQARAQILAGDVEFSTLRNRRDAAMKEKIIELLGAEEGERFSIMLGGGELNKPVAALQMALKENHFARMLNLTSVVRNAVARLERKEISPVWKGPLGYYLIRVNGVGLLSLEGEYEDYIDQTKFEYPYDQFYRWANAALTSAKMVD